MSDSWWHRHPVLAGAASTVLGAAICAGAAQLLGWVSLKAVWRACAAALVTAWHWLGATSPLQHWLLVLLSLCALACLAVIGVLIAVAREKHGPPLPTEGEYFNMRWRWRWDSSGQLTRPEPFCLVCDLQLLPERESGREVGMIGKPYVQYRCGPCGEVRMRSQFGSGDHYSLQEQVMLYAQRDLRKAAQ